MTDINQELWKLIVLFPLGLVLVWIGNFLGSFFDFLFEKEGDSVVLPIGRTLLGYLLLATVFSLAFFQFKTLFTPVAILLGTFLYLNRKQIKPDFKVPFWQIQILTYASLYLFRLFSVVDFSTNEIKLFFKDDYLYSTTIASLFYSRQENVFYEILNQQLGYESFYTIYHYFSFSGAILLKVITGWNSFWLFNLYTVPFFQFVGVMGLFSIAIFYRINYWKALLYALLVFTTLRYNPFDEAILNLIQNDKLSRNLIFKNFFGTQFLNSGFGTKFCLALGMVCLLYIFIDRKKVVTNALMLVFINPLMVFISASVAVPIVVFRRNLFGPLILQSILIAGFFIGFLVLSGGRQGSIDMNEISENFHQFWALGPMHFLFFGIGEVMNQCYNLFLIPLILVIVYRKNWTEQLFASLFILYPIFNSLLLESLIYKVFIVALMADFGWILFASLKKERWFYLLSIFGITILASRFSLVFPEFNQAFMFINFTFPLVIVMHILCRLQLKPLWIHLGLGLVLIVNVIQNYEENSFRPTRIAINGPEMTKIKNWTEGPKSAQLSIIGIFNSKMTLQFLNQFLKGEEISLANDRFFPTPVSIPQLGSQNPLNSNPIRKLIPICNFADGQKQANPSLEFIEQSQIKLVVVNDYDSVNFASIRPLFSDSVQTKLGYRIYHRL